MIIPLINQKMLSAFDSQAESCKVAEVLRVNGIEFYEKTVRTGTSGTMARMNDANVLMQTRMKGYENEVGGGYTYIIYVKRKDYERAKALM